MESKSGSRVSWWWAICTTHGKQMHLSYIGGACVECQKKRLGE